MNPYAAARVMDSDGGLRLPRLSLRRDRRRLDGLVTYSFGRAFVSCRRRGFRAKRRPRAAEQRPERLVLLDEALHAAVAMNHRHRRPAPDRGRRDVIVEQDRAVRPFALVALVANGEIEMFESVLDRIAQQLAQ